jgi:hypothetical protein
MDSIEGQYIHDSKDGFYSMVGTTDLAILTKLHDIYLLGLQAGYLLNQGDHF